VPKSTEYCGDCARYQTVDCPKCEFKEGKLNTTASMASDAPCDLFESKKGGANTVEGRESQADMLVKLALTNIKELFHDNRTIPYIRLANSNVTSTVRVRSRETKSWLAGLLWKDQEKAANQEALSSALNVLEAQCQEGPEYKLYNRIAPGEDDSIWFDMADKKWRAIHITKEGWQIVDNPPVLFRRYSHQKVIPEPVRGGKVEEILEFANIKGEGDKLLYIVTMITELIPDIPHVIIILFGPQGSGKTWALKVMRALIDPSHLDLLNLPTRERELVQNLDHHWCSFYDNVGRVPERISNVFCRAVTGAGVSKRALYTDDDDVIYSYHRCIGLTDINIAAERGDMLQRSLLLGLQGIPKKTRKTEKKLTKALEKAHPRILGAMLDVLVKAINIYPSMKLDGLHRMADYLVWACAITEVMGIDQQVFLDAYEENIINQNLEMVRASPISDALIKFMEEQPNGCWEGTPSQLFTALEEKAKELKISTRQKAWPKKPHVLSRRLNELAPSLPSVGYEVVITRTIKERLIRVYSVDIDRKTCADTVNSVHSVMPEKVDHGKHDAINGINSTFESFSGHKKLATLGKNSSKGPIPLKQKTKEAVNIDKAFKSPEQDKLEQQLREEWSGPVKKETQETEFVTLIRKHRPDWNRDMVGKFFTQLIERGKMTYNPEKLLVWVR